MRILLLLFLLVSIAQAEVLTVQGSSPPIYLGAAADTKPISGVKVGSTFIETDTNHIYLWSGSEERGTSANWVSKIEGTNHVCIDDADKVCKASAGYLHSVWCYGEDAGATAGTVRITNTTAAGGAETTEVWGDDFAAAAYSPRSAILDIVMDTGIVIDFTTTADVKCGVSYR